MRKDPWKLGSSCVFRCRKQGFKIREYLQYIFIGFQPSQRHTRDMDRAFVCPCKRTPTSDMHCSDDVLTPRAVTERRLRFLTADHNELRAAACTCSSSANPSRKTFPSWTCRSRALYLLAAPSTPEPVRDEVLSRAKGGEKMTVAEVKETIAEAAPPDPILPGPPRRDDVVEKVRASKEPNATDTKGRAQSAKKSKKAKSDASAGDLPPEPGSERGSFGQSSLAMLCGEAIALALRPLLHSARPRFLSWTRLSGGQRLTFCANSWASHRTLANVLTSVGTAALWSFSFSFSSPTLSCSSRRTSDPPHRLEFHLARNSDGRSRA